MIRLFDRDQPARYPDKRIPQEFNQYEFETYHECALYVHTYMGKYSPGPARLEETLRRDGVISIDPFWLMISVDDEIT